MIETAQNAKTKRAFEKAHQARGQVMLGLLQWLFGPKAVPLDLEALTEPSRCA